MGFPDDLYQQLTAQVSAQGVSIEQLLRTWAGTQQTAERVAGPAVLARVAALGDELTTRYGEMPDSSDLIRDDRAR